MAEQFIGMTVSLTLSNNAQLKGTVAKVDSTTQILHLREVCFLPNGGIIPNYSIEASHITSLDIVPSSTPILQLSSSPAPPPQAAHIATSAEFRDPAILSFSRKPTESQTPASSQYPLQPTPPLMLRTASTPMDLSQTFEGITLSPPDPPFPTTTTTTMQQPPSLLRPKPRKPAPPPSPSPQLKIPQRQRNTPNSRSRRRAYSRLSDSGWLTDEIVGGQVDDFDFESNLTKFDKRRDWEEFRKLDNTDPTSLLVWANRTATAPRYTQTQQNLSHKTNVLDGFGSTESDSNEEPVLPRRGSKQSRPRGGTGTNRKISNLSAKESVSGRTSAVGTRWTVVGEDMGDIISVTAEQMANAEKVALDSGLSEDVLIENAARGIAEAVLTSLGSKRLDKKNHNPAPLVVVLAGNNRTGAYSLGAGRWLSLRGIRVLGVVCGSEDDELEIIRTQLKLFKNAGGRKVIPADLQRVISALPSPPEITIDGLFGYLHSVDDLWDDEDRLTSSHLIKWANGLRGRRISIDKPAAARDLNTNTDISIAAEWIIQVGAIKEDIILDKPVRVFVVDLGLGKSVWKEVGVAGTGKKRKGDLGIAWGGKWVVELENIV